MECERCGEPNRTSVLWCRLCGHVLGSKVDPLPPLAALTESELAQITREVEKQTPSPALLIVTTVLLGWTGVPRMLLGQVDAGIALTVVSGVLGLGAIALRVGEHPAAPLLVVALVTIWVVNALAMPGAYSRTIAHVRRAALLKVTSEQ